MFTNLCLAEMVQGYLLHSINEYIVQQRSQIYKARLWFYLNYLLRRNLVITILIAALAKYIQEAKIVKFKFFF